MEQYLWIVWSAILVLGLVVEAIGPGLVSIWFSAGALVSLAISFIPGCEWWIQLIVFIIVTVVCVAALRPFMKKFLKKDIVSSNSDALIGQVGVTLEEVTDSDPGEIKVAGSIWHAKVLDGEEKIPSDTKVKVLRIQGNTLIVTKAE